MTTIKPPSPPYLGPAAHTTPGDNRPIRRIVLHSTVGPTKAGSARAIARYFRGETAGGSAHYVVDASEVVQVVFDRVIAWQAPPNRGSLGVEMCDYPDRTTAARWKDADHKAMLDRTALLVAQLALAYDVPIRWRGVRGLKLGLTGITTHANVAVAFGQSTHWDPGAWPRRRFMRAVRRHALRLWLEAAR